MGDYQIVSMFLTVLSLMAYGLAIWRGILYVRRQWRLGLPMPGWVVLGGVFAVVVVLFLSYTLYNRIRGVGPNPTTTTLSLLLYFFGAMVMNGLISILGRGGKQ